MFSFIPRIAAEGLLCARLCVRLMVTIIARIAEGFTTHKSLCCRIPYVPTTTLRDACHCPHIQVRTLRPKRERQLAQGCSTRRWELCRGLSREPLWSVLLEAEDRATFLRSSLYPYDSPRCSSPVGNSPRGRERRHTLMKRLPLAGHAHTLSPDHLAKRL